ncbi:MAG: DUF86 domain-containing protein [Candidatus Stahlbacteria bacterium]|nr:DUF86 domain-containing protein [Candidatus Stahlbacteria bacterium]
MTREYLLFIQDILKAINDIDKFVGDMSFEEFCNDGKTKSAIVWQIHIIGEATKNVPKSIIDKYKEVPWKYMARIRDKIAHLYFGIDYEIVWDVVRNKFPEVKPLIEKILKEMKE